MSVAEFPPRTTPPSSDTLSASAYPGRFSISLEQAAYLGLFILALITRLWALDGRALHHDETHHAYYSWLLFQGRGYVHDPLLHGPFLYHLGALIYFLFGDNNATARLGVGLFGSVLVVLPYLLRRELGRGAALLAAAYMLISPTFLYVGRFIRHDPYAVVFELLAFIGIVRYVSTHQARWLYVCAASLALMLTTMETFFLYLAIFVPLLALVFFWRVWRPGIAVTAALGLALVALVFVLPGKPEQSTEGGAARANGPYVCPTGDRIITARNPFVAEPGPLFGLPPLATADNSYALCVRHQPDNNLGVYIVKLGQFVDHPAILGAIALTIVGLGGLYWAVWRRRDDVGTTAWVRAGLRPDGLMSTFESLGRDRRLWIAGALFFAIYALFFTAFFTNTAGVVTGVAGSLLYWLGQHEVQRGGQPGYYYLVIMAVYEPLLLLWGSVGLAMAGALAVRKLRSRPPPPGPVDWSVAMPLMLAWWAVVTLVLYSWAGEKMPWLTLHVALPLVLLGAWALGRTLTWWWAGRAGTAAETMTGVEGEDATGQAGLRRTALAARAYETLPLVSYLAIFGVVLVTSFVLLSIVAKPDSPQNYLAPFVPLLAVLLLALLTFGYGMVRGARWAVGALVIGVTVFGALGAARSAYQVSYLWGDVPRELLVYTQTSPDVARVIDRLEFAATKRGGALDMPIWYDNETVWNWYMRRFSGASEQSPALAGAPPQEVMAVLMLQENYDRYPQNQQSLQGFRVQRFPLRWWFPEYETYRMPEDWLTAPVTERSPLLMRVLRTPFDGRTSAQFWQFMLYRQMPVALGSTDFVLAVRPELVPDIGLGTGAEQ